MTDADLSALAAATKAMFDARDLTMRVEMAELRASVASMETELRDVRAESKTMRTDAHAFTMRAIATLGTTLSAALPAAVREAAERHIVRLAVQRAMPTEGTS
jgi:hypothetical protein